jgi:hypothetical protein
MNESVKGYMGEVRKVQGDMYLFNHFRIHHPVIVLDHIADRRDGESMISKVASNQSVSGRDAMLLHFIFLNRGVSPSATAISDRLRLHGSPNNKASRGKSTPTRPCEDRIASPPRSVLPDRARGLLSGSLRKNLSRRGGGPVAGCKGGARMWVLPPPPASILLPEKSFSII